MTSRLSSRYTLLQISDVSRFLGCTLLSTDLVLGCAVVVGMQLPRPLSQLANRHELTTWLTRQVISTIRSGQSENAVTRVVLPNNFVAFIGLLVHLHSVGYPGHWLTDFLNTILADNLVTDIAPYVGILPIPVSEIRRRVPRRKVRLDPWLADLENILAPSWRGLPFPISLPANFAKTPEEIGTYAASCSINNPMVEMFHPGDPTIILVFYKATPSINENKITDAIPNMFEGKPFPAVGNIVILTTQEAVDQHKELRWRLNRKRAEEMMRGKWFVVAVRGDMLLSGLCSFVLSTNLS